MQRAQRKSGLRLPARASLWYVLSSAAARGVSMLGTPIFTRLLSPEEYGLYPLFNLWLGLFFAFATLELTGSALYRALQRFEGERAQVLSARENEYIVAARAMGEKESSIMFKQILPNILSQLLVTATLSFATCMLTESSLSYLGFGIVPPTPTWGNLLMGANDSTVIQQFWWRWVFTATIFGITTISINLMGDGMRDAIDPKSLER